MISLPFVFVCSRSLQASQKSRALILGNMGLIVTLPKGTSVCGGGGGGGSVGGDGDGGGVAEAARAGDGLEVVGVDVDFRRTVDDNAGFDGVFTGRCDAATALATEAAMLSATIVVAVIAVARGLRTGDKTMGAIPPSSPKAAAAGTTAVVVSSSRS